MWLCTFPVSVWVVITAWKFRRTPFHPLSTDFMSEFSAAFVCLEWLHKMKCFYRRFVRQWLCIEISAGIILICQTHFLFRNFNIIGAVNSRNKDSVLRFSGFAMYFRQPLTLFPIDMLLIYGIRPPEMFKLPKLVCGNISACICSSCNLIYVAADFIKLWNITVTAAQIKIYKPRFVRALQVRNNRSVLVYWVIQGTGAALSAEKTATAIGIFFLKRVYFPTTAHVPLRAWRTKYAVMWDTVKVCGQG